MGFVSQDVMQRLLSQRPCPLAVIYWGPERVAPREALHLLTVLERDERLLVLGRFAYIEAPPPGAVERRHGEATDRTAQPSLRLADIWTDPAYAAELERRVVQALEPSSLSTSSQALLSRAQMPQRTLEAMCFVLEEKGTLKIVMRSGAEEAAAGGEFVVLRGAQPAGS